MRKRKAVLLGGRPTAFVATGLLVWETQANSSF
eukprot:COSAG02_NODE_58054_length_278_cov_1.162011_1_plen_32_part_10